jgi:hypothetical protein
MWRQLSGFDKFRFVACVIGLPVTVFGTILFAMEHQWVKAAIQALLIFSFSYYLYKLATRGRGKAELQPDPINPGTPPQQSSNPTVVIGIIFALIVLGVGGFFGYEHFVKHGSPPTALNASDNSFTVTVSPHWQTANVPHATAYVLLLAHYPFGSMVVLTGAPKSTLQELGKSAVDEVVNQTKAVIDPDGGLQPTTVDGEAALRLSYTLTQPIGQAPAGAHGQQYYVLHRNVEYIINFTGEPAEYASAHADFDAIMHSWKWSQPAITSQPSG